MIINLFYRHLLLVLILSINNIVLCQHNASCLCDSAISEQYFQKKFDSRVDFMVDNWDSLLLKLNIECFDFLIQDLFILRNRTVNINYDFDEGIFGAYMIFDEDEIIRQLILLKSLP